MSKPDEFLGEHEDSEMLRFEDQLRALKPRPAKATLNGADANEAKVVLTKHLTLESERVSERVQDSRSSFNGWSLSKWALAGCLLLMWGLGAGMGAVAALAWVTLDRVGVEGEAPLAQPPIVARANEATHDDHASPQPVPGQVPTHAQAAVESEPSIIPKLLPSDPSSASSEFRSVLAWWVYGGRQPNEQLVASSDPWTPRTAYLIAHQGVSLASNIQPMSEQFATPANDGDSELISDAQQIDAPEAIVPFKPSQATSQRDLLRGILNSESGQVF